VMAKSELYQVVEFYLSGTSKPFLRRTGITNIPRVGDSVDARGITGDVVAVTWNLDYAEAPHENWRCNIFIKPPTDGKPRK